MTTIQDRQVDPKAVRLQVAARRFYRNAKVAKRFRVGVAGVLAIIGPVAVLIKPAILPVLGAAAALWVFLSRIGLQGFEDKQRELGARSQESFDVFVLEIPWNAALSRAISEEEIVAAARKEGAQTQHDPWYPDTGDTAWPKNVLLCHRANTVWARRQHAAYAWLVGGVAVLCALVGVGVALFVNASLVLYLTTICLPSLPALLESVDSVRDHLAASSDRDLLEESIETHLADGNADLSTLRQIQDRIYELRARAPLVPEWFYKILRNDYEADMEQAAATLRRNDQTS